MKPGININCSKYPFDTYIKNRFKLYETRNRNTLGTFVGRRVFLIKTGCGKPLIFAEATVSKAIKCRNRGEFNDYVRECMTYATDYDWNEKTKCKWLYKLDEIVPINNREVSKDAICHGYVWREIEE